MARILYNWPVVSVVAVAQLVESRIVIPVVVGSSPIGHPTKFNDKKPGDSGLFVFLRRHCQPPQRNHLRRPSTV